MTWPVWTLWLWQRRRAVTQWAGVAALVATIAGGYVGCGVARLQRDAARAEAKATHMQLEVITAAVIRTNEKWEGVTAEAEAKHAAAKAEAEAATARTAALASEAAKAQAHERELARELEAARVAAITARDCRGAWSQYLEATGQAAGGTP